MIGIILLIIFIAFSWVFGFALARAAKSGDEISARVGKE